jgi:hypothetical protein
MLTYECKNPPTIEDLGIISLPFSRREIDGYKVPSKYITYFLRVL